MSGAWSKLLPLQQVSPTQRLGGGVHGASLGHQQPSSFSPGLQMLAWEPGSLVGSDEEGAEGMGYVGLERQGLAGFRYDWVVGTWDARILHPVSSCLRRPRSPLGRFTRLDVEPCRRRRRHVISGGPSLAMGDSGAGEAAVLGEFSDVPLAVCGWLEAGHGLTVHVGCCHRRRRLWMPTRCEYLLQLSPSWT